MKYVSWLINLKDNKMHKSTHKAVESAKVLKDFQKMTAKLLTTKRHPIDPTIEHCIDGIGSEAGELVNAGKRIKWYGTEPDYTNLLEECGDILFYMDRLLCKIGSSFDEAMQANMKKLSVRYKDHEFTKEQAIDRDLDKEREVLDKSAATGCNVDFADVITCWFCTKYSKCAEEKGRSIQHDKACSKFNEAKG